MSTPQFTPGPWLRVLNEPEAIGVLEKRGDSTVIRYIATVEGDFDDWVDDGCDVEAEANARLLAAAPELYAALAEFADWFGPIEDNELLGEECRNCFRLARAAFAKVRGDA